jgi:hypothetical protein
MRSATVAQGEGARLAAVVSLVLASAKVRDHVADGDGVLGRRAVSPVARRVASGWAEAGVRAGGELGFDTAVLLDAADRQQQAELAVAGGGSLLTVTEPSETATAAAFAHTAVLAGRPANAEPLAEAGRLFGRLAHLLDAVEDLAADEAAGAWNPLAATGTDLGEARRLCDDAVHGIRLALSEVDFVDGRLAHLLLSHELPRSVRRVFHAGGGGCAGRSHGRGAAPEAEHRQASRPPGTSPWITGDPAGPPPPPRRRRGLVAGCAVWTGLCCTGQVCCRDPYDDPWSGEPREGWCHKCSDGCECCDCCNCCSCNGDGNSGDGGCCDCCDCDCGCG